MKKLIYPAALILLFIILTTTISACRRRLRIEYGLVFPSMPLLRKRSVTPAWNSTRFFPTGSISEAEAADISFLIMDF